MHYDQGRNFLTRKWRRMQEICGSTSQFLNPQGFTFFFKLHDTQEYSQRRTNSWEALGLRSGVERGSRRLMKGYNGVYERVRSEMHGEMDAKAAKRKAYHRQMREEMDAKAATIDATQ
uniref:Uncharacterized protein n=1 Tax=Lactuca sativa TaxID=4236 RepID=A0A9R1VQD7_LACSA|nr:hypothetical protein LSAT_V11C400210780 [Lactuca sativa]